MPFLEVRDLTIEFSRGAFKPPLRAVDGVSFSLYPGETVGLVGESGSGKTTIGRAILGLVPNTAGSITLDGGPILRKKLASRRAVSSQIQVVFQDPYSSLNPARTIGQTLSETLHVHRRSLSKRELLDSVHTSLQLVGLPPAATERYPAHFSGGQRQRIAIARALILKPRLIICDEPTSALDLAVQAQVINLLRDLQAELALSYLFISHDLAVVRYLSQRLVILYNGKVMEAGATADVMDAPSHPYTRALLDSMPVTDPRIQAQRRLSRTANKVGTTSVRTGEANAACVFAPRCVHASDVCRTTEPPSERTGEGTLVACHHWRDIRRASE
jgi:oligopeptide/dipeptide ABC transporter ATP-binding protein